jgi:hypothetical protein
MAQQEKQYLLLMPIFSGHGTASRAEAMTQSSETVMALALCVN